MRFDCEKPILVGVNGVAVGIGVSLAMSGDIRLASPSARFHPGYARVGASPDGGLTWTLPEAIGYERAMRFFLENRMVPASEALAIGMVGEVTETDDAFEPRFLEYGQLLAAIAPIAARQTKHLVGRNHPSIGTGGSPRCGVQADTAGVHYGGQQGGRPGDGGARATDVHRPLNRLMAVPAIGRGLRPRAFSIYDFCGSRFQISRS
jgi:1,4-dihydroxy-2-naphthoyl-CoA synthase